jgi:hypothetical protein
VIDLKGHERKASRRGKMEQKRKMLKRAKDGKERGRMERKG